MAKKILKKAQVGREVTKSNSGQYKIITTDNGTKVRRTFKGVIKGAPTVAEANANRADALKNPSYSVKKQAERIAGRNLGDMPERYREDLYNRRYNQFITDNAVDKSNIKKFGDFKKGGTAKKTIKKKK